MLSLNDIINISFRKTPINGYRTEEVDFFVERIRESYDELLKKAMQQEEDLEKLRAENKQYVEKLKVLANKIEDYRTQESEIKTALVSAQKLGDASVREARHKAEIIVKDATLRGDRIIADTEAKLAREKKEFAALQQTVSDFRSKLLNLYREHLELIDAIPSQNSQEASVQQDEQSVPQEPQAEEEPAEFGPAPEEENLTEPDFSPVNEEPAPQEQKQPEPQQSEPQEPETEEQPGSHFVFTSQTGQTGQTDRQVSYSRPNSFFYHMDEQDDAQELQTQISYFNDNTPK